VPRKAALKRMIGDINNEKGKKRKEKKEGNGIF
jgi:hypothetical protein